MNYWNMRFISQHYFMLLRRNRIFIGYFFFAFVTTIVIQATAQNDEFTGTTYHSPAAIPYMNVYLFSVFQALAAIVFGNEIFYNSRQADSLEAIYYRPASNTEHVAGALLGFIKMFSLIYAIFWIAALTLHLFVIDTSITWKLYVIYPLAIILPGMVFLSGFSCWVSQIVKNRLLALLVQMCALGLLVGYGGETWQGALDPLGLALPAGYSDFTGMAHPGDFWLQRASWLLLGLGCCMASALTFPRLPNQTMSRKRVSLMAGFIVAGLLVGSLPVGHYLGRLADRNAYINVYKQYANVPKSTMLAQEIDYSQQGQQIEVTTRMTLANGTGKPLTTVVLYLNPNLAVRELREGEKTLAFTREKQIVKVDRPIEAGDTVTWTMTYAGDIDETICHVNIPESKWKTSTEVWEMNLRQGKRFAYLEADYTLLTPATLWYPAAVPPENPVAIYHSTVDFTRYKLRVSNPRRLTVISQGQRYGTLEDIHFRPEYPLTGITLCMGHYKTRRVTVDNVTYEINLLEGHEHLLDPYYSAERFNVENAIRQTRHRIEQELGKKYPFPRLIFTEIPSHFISYFQPERGASQFVQPELVLGLERGRGWLQGISPDQQTFYTTCFFMDNNTLTERFSWETYFAKLTKNAHMLLKNYGLTSVDVNQGTGNPMLPQALLYEHTGHVQSSRFPFINAFVQEILIDNNLTSTDGRASQDKEKELAISFYLADRSFEEAFQDSELNPSFVTYILRLESREFLDRLTLKGIPVDSTREFLIDYLAAHAFRNVEFNNLNMAFNERFGVDMAPIMEAQYLKKGLPSYIVEAVEEEITREEKRRFSRYRIFNNSNVDGIVHIEKSLPIDNNGEFGFFKRYFNYQYEAYEIKAGTGIEIRTDLSNVLKTNLSRNLPGRYEAPFTGYTTDTSQYVRSLPREAFFPPANTIIVDNEDKGCHTYQPLYSWLERWRERNKAPWEKYHTSPSLSVSHWTTLLGGYGHPVQSCLYKEAGKGNAFVEWHIDLPQAGEYEVWIYIPTSSGFTQQPIQHYFITQGEQEEQIAVELTSEDKWLLLGTFTFKAGECTIRLIDKGKDGQFIYADAVKWVKL